MLTPRSPVIHQLEPLAVKRVKGVGDDKESLRFC